MDLRRWVIVYVAAVSGEKSDDIDPDEPMSIYDFDSIDAVEMAMEFERKFDRPTEPELFLRSDQSLNQLVAALERIEPRP